MGDRSASTIIIIICVSGGDVDRVVSFVFHVPVGAEAGWSSYETRTAITSFHCRLCSADLALASPSAHPPSSNNSDNDENTQPYNRKVKLQRHKFPNAFNYFQIGTSWLLSSLAPCVFMEKERITEAHGEAQKNPPSFRLNHFTFFD